MLGIRKWPIIPTIVVIAAAAFMVRLGFWQLGRLEEKEALIASFAQNAELALASGFNPAQAEDFQFRKVQLDCPRPSQWQGVAGRSSDGAAGFTQRYLCRTLSVPGETESEMAEIRIHADIGWTRDPAKVNWPGGRVTGLLAPMGDEFKIIADPPLAGLQPLARPDPKELPNNHLAYAGQWFFFAITALVIYVLALRRKQRDDGTVSDGE